MITASQVKELREMTGAGMMDCKKALTECDGDMTKAVDWLREKGIAKAAKKSDRIAAEGLSRAAVEGNVAVVFEVNSETDFVAKNEQFLGLLDTIQNVLLTQKPADLDAALACTVDGASVADLITNATATIGEKISLRRIAVVEKADDEFFGSYIHMGGKISALAVLKGKEDAKVAKDVVMQIASMNPKYITRDDMPADVVEHERKVQTEIVANDEKLANKPEKVLAGIIEGKVSKNLKDLCLVEQEFFLNPDQTVGQYLKENGAEVVSFVRYAVGEGIEEAAQAGILGGFPVLGVHANVYDGSYHEVDSSEMAFHIAGSMAFKEAMAKASPVLLEPIMKVEVTMPEEYMGDVIGDINSRRGRIEGMDDIGGGKMVKAYVPLAEMFGYSTDLRSKTQGRGNYSMFFEKYEPVPKSVQEKVLADKSK